jgi:hypothetical protein
VMANSLVLYVNFGGEPALAADLNDYVMQSFIEQLRNQRVDVEEDKFVRHVYRAELRSFERGIYGRLRTTNPAEYEQKEIELLERKVLAHDHHLQASLRYATRSLKRQVVIFLDNIDQRDFEFQEKVFLIGQSLAETWPATVFLSLRPETFHRSRSVGSLTAYQPRVFTITPPKIAEVIDKRLRFCGDLVQDDEIRGRLLPEPLHPQADTLATYLTILRRSFERNRGLREFVENISGGNVRAALGLLNTFVGSGHVDTHKIFDIFATSGTYTIPLHEFVRAVIYGDYQHYEPPASPIANLFEISTDDGREHFLLVMLLAHVERAGDVGQTGGFVAVDDLLRFAQTFGFMPAQAEFALRHAVDTRLMQLNPEDAREHGRAYRITTVGAYTYRRLLGRFVYIDAVVSDTPVVDEAFAADLKDCRDIADRVARAEIFRRYLDSQWRRIEGATPFDWEPVSAQLRRDLDYITRRVDLPPLEADETIAATEEGATSAK